MAARKAAGRTKKAGTARAKAPALSPEKRAAQREIQRGIAHLGKSIAEIRRGLGKAERQIELDARKRIAALRKDGRAQLAGLAAKRREVLANLKQASASAGASWDELKQSAESALADAIHTAGSYVNRIRDALTR